MKITDALVAEHRVFLTMFDFIEEVLPTVQSLAEVQILGRLVERLLCTHALAEDNLVLLALDHVLEDKSQRARFQEEHQELDAQLKQLQKISDLAQGRAFLKSAIGAARKHFKHEEKDVFPTAEKVMQAETLQSLGKALLETKRPGH